MKKEKGWLTDASNNLEWRMKCSTCSTATEIRKDGIILTSLAVALEKGPPTQEKNRYCYNFENSYRVTHPQAA